MEEKNSKEINLLQLITLLLDWLKKVFIGFVNILGSILKLSYRQFIVLIIVVGVSVVIGQYLARKSARVYKAEAMAMIYGSDAQTVIEISKQLENSSPLNPLTTLGTKLSLPDSVAKNIVEFHTYYVIDYMKDSVADIVDFKNNHSLTDTTNIRMKDRVYFRILTKNIAQVPLVQEALLNHLNNNKVLKDGFENKRNEYSQKIIICDIELKRIDSLAKVSYFKENDKQLRFDKNKLIVGEQQKQLFWGELLRLQELKSIAQEKLSEFKQPINLPSDFVVIPIPINGRIKYGIYSLLIGYILSLLIAVILENYKKVFKYLRS
ncbi:MAG: hypothetical protein PHS59_15525 [Paludibacter sp.]|nr:hypothetical protein [Paludibacter sp.]